MYEYKIYTIKEFEKNNKGEYFDIENIDDCICELCNSKMNINGFILCGEIFGREFYCWNCFSRIFKKLDEILFG